MDKKGLLGISPLILFVVFFVTAALISGDFTKVPVTVVFFFTTIYAIAITRHETLPDRVRIFGRGAGTTRIIFILCIIICAGAFASTASAMGAVSETVNAILTVLPPRLIFAALFIAGCVLSMASGSGVGTIAAIGPIAVGVGEALGTNMALVCSIVVTGAMFGDNLSFISDTTIVATTSQGCQMKDKFRENIRLVTIPALIVLALYIFLGRDAVVAAEARATEYWKILPYVVVLIMAFCGGDVLITILTGLAVSGIEGLILGSFDFFGWMEAMNSGITGMGELIIIILMAAGLMNLVKNNGGIDYLVALSLRLIKGRRSAEGCIALLAGAMTACTSNNTVAIMSISTIVKEISDKYGISPKRAASLMDTSTCVVQELIPYSTHLLAAAAFAGITAASIIPYMAYSFLLAIAIVVTILIPSRKPAGQKAV